MKNQKAKNIVVLKTLVIIVVVVQIILISIRHLEVSLKKLKISTAWIEQKLGIKMLNYISLFETFPIFAATLAATTAAVR